MTPEFEQLIRGYWARGLGDKQIQEILLEKHIDRSKYSLSYESFRKMRHRLGLKGARQQSHTVESIHSNMLDIRDRHPNAGVSDLRNLLRVESEGGELRVPRSLIQHWNQTYEPERVEARRSRVTVRKPFICAGVNEIWAFDQHDKWKRFGLWLHVGLDTYSGYVLWFKTWWTNSNPRLICKYFLDAIENQGDARMPMLTQSDPGTENFGIANAQSTLRQMMDQGLTGTMQHIHSRKHGNIKPEIFWSGFRRRFSPALEQLFEEGVERGIYDPHVHVEYLVFRYIFMGLLQDELDLYVKMVNTSPRRANRKAVLPHDAPMNIYERPTKYGSKDFKISVPMEAINHVRQLYAPPQDPVFVLLPPEFAAHAQQLHRDLGGEPIERSNAWFFYQGIITHFHNYELGILASEQVLYQGQLYRMLLDQSETGSSRGDAWGYDIQLIGPALEMNDGVAGLEDLDEMGELDVGEFSGEEDLVMEQPTHFSDSTLI